MPLLPVTARHRQPAPAGLSAAQQALPGKAGVLVTESRNCSTDAFLVKFRKTGQGRGVARRHPKVPTDSLPGAWAGVLWRPRPAAPPVAPTYSGCRQHPAIGMALPHGSMAGVVLNPGPCGHCQHWDVPSSRDHLGCHEARGVPTELQDNSKGDTESAAGEDRQPGSAAVDQELLKS